MLNMDEVFSIVEMVKDDILRILCEKGRKASLNNIKEEIRASSPFILKAIKELKEKNLIQTKQDSLELTEEGRINAKDILKRHLFLEDYFKRSGNEKEADRKADILEHYISEEVARNIKILSTLKEGGIPLPKSRLNDIDFIVDITTTNNELFERMVSIGISPGEKIILTNCFSHGVVIKIDNSKVFLDKKIAEKIKVVKP